MKISCSDKLQKEYQAFKRLEEEEANAAARRRQKRGADKDGEKGKKREKKMVKVGLRR